MMLLACVDKNKDKIYQWLHISFTFNQRQDPNINETSVYDYVIPNSKSNNYVSCDVHKIWNTAWKRRNVTSLIYFDF